MCCEILLKPACIQSSPGLEVLNYSELELMKRVNMRVGFTLKENADF